MSSTDGITWTGYNAPGGDIYWSSVTYGNGTFVAVGGGNSIMTSTDGITWTLRTSPVNNSWAGVAYGNGRFVAISGGTEQNAIISTDGINWAAGNLSENNYWYGITYGNGKFVTVAQAGGLNRVATSTDGTSWDVGEAAENSYWNAITYGNDMFVAVAYSGADGARLAMSSPDGKACPSAGGSLWQMVGFYCVHVGGKCLVGDCKCPAGTHNVGSNIGTAGTSCTDVGACGTEGADGDTMWMQCVEQ